MTTVLRLVVALLLSMAILQIGGGLFGTLLGFRAALEGFSREAIGMLMAAYYVGFLAGTQLGAWLVRTVGHIRTFAASAAVVSAIVLVHGIVVDPYVWAVLRVATGVALAGLFMVIESWLNGQASNQIRGRVFSAYMMVNLLAMTGGQLLLQIGDPATHVLFAVSAMLFAISLVPVSVSRITAPTPPLSTARMPLSRLFAISPLGIAGCFCVGLVNGSVWGLAPAFAHDIGYGTAGVSYFMTALTLGGVVLQWPIGYLSDRFDRRGVIVGVSITAALASFLIVFLGHMEAALFALAALFGGMVLSLYSLCVSHVNDRLESDEVVGASSALLLVFGCGAILGPIVAGVLTGAIGPEALFMFVGTVNLALLLFTAWRMLRRSAPKPEEQSAFVPVARTTPIVLSLDPRAETPDESAAIDGAPANDEPQGPGRP